MRIRLPWSKQTVTCADCGYLCYQRAEKLGEVPPSVRRGDEEHGWAYLENVGCFKHASDLFGETGVPMLGKPDRFGQDSVDYAAVRAALAKKRDCRFFYRYRPGYDAALHRDLEDQGRREMASRVWNGVFLLLGSGLTLVVTIIVLLLT
jgi:hypothetical protein